ncbi:hypothetical protein [Acholeplasma hippikon]|uniref:hypothetical protein n=1 Tax=Acholeplasma hippikon TaxID=264636 RepID=UPI00101BCCEC|nr:hypothetical protein [Acholeplasma hippikon]
MKKILLNEVKDKKLRFFYESIYDMLENITLIKDIEYLEKLEKDFLAFKNGYTDKSKLFKNLRKAQIFNKELVVDLFILLIKQRVFYLNNPKVKRMDDLLRYAYEQSFMSFFLMISNPSSIKQIELIKSLSTFDCLSNLILYAEEKINENEITFPSQMLEDYAIEYTLDGKIMMNDNYLFLIDYLFKKIKENYQFLEININQLNEPLNYMLLAYIKHQMDLLQTYFKKLYNKK